MTTYLAAYDTENVSCLAAIRRIVDVHEKFEMPATFFLLTRLLEKDGEEYRKLIAGNPLFEIASHSREHLLLRPHRLCGAPTPAENHESEIVESKRILEDFFEREIVGFRPPVMFWNGFLGAPELQGYCAKAGYRYISSVGWGAHDSLPALPRDPFDYAEEGCPGLWEIPASGWHENLLKGNNKWDPRPIQLYPHPMPEANISGFLNSPREEFDLNRLFIDRAVGENARHVTLIWHPWSLGRFDPEMKMLELTFDYVRGLDIPTATFADYAETL